MTLRIVFAILALTSGGAATLTGQTGHDFGATNDVSPASSIATSPVRVLDPRLRVEPVARRDAVRASSLEGWADSVARPRWRYPAIGAAVGVAAGLIHASAITQGDYVGFPVEPMILLPSAYGLAGAFIGLLVDSADRERAARR